MDLGETGPGRPRPPGASHRKRRLRRPRRAVAVRMLRLPAAAGAVRLRAPPRHPLRCGAPAEAPLSAPACCPGGVLGSVVPRRLPAAFPSRGSAGDPWFGPYKTAQDNVSRSAWFCRCLPKIGAPPSVPRHIAHHPPVTPNMACLWTINSGVRSMRRQTSSSRTQSTADANTKTS